MVTRRPDEYEASGVNGDSTPLFLTLRDSRSSVIPHRCDLPTARSSAALERPDDARGYPAAIEIALLRLHPLLADPALIHARGIEGEIAGERRKRRGRPGIAPCRIPGAPAVDLDRPVSGLALELAPGTSRRG